MTNATLRGFASGFPGKQWFGPGGRQSAKAIIITLELPRADSGCTKNTTKKVSEE